MITGWKKALIACAVVIAAFLVLLFGIGIVLYAVNTVQIKGPEVSAMQEELNQAHSEVTGLKITSGRNPPSARIEITVKDADEAELDALLEDTVAYFHQNCLYETVMDPQADARGWGIMWVEIRFYQWQGLRRTLLREYDSNSIWFSDRTAVSADFNQWTWRDGGAMHTFVYPELEKGS